MIFPTTVTCAEFWNIAIVLPHRLLQLSIGIFDVAASSHNERLIGEGECVIDKWIDDVGHDKDVTDSPSRVLP